MEDLFEISFLTLLVCREINHCLSKKALRLGLTPLELQVLWAVVRSGGSHYPRVSTPRCFSKG